MGIVAATTVLLSLQASSPVAAQILPSINSEPSNTGIAFIGQNSTAPVQNNTSTNITQLATVLPFTNQPIQPASYSPSSNNDDDNDDSSSSSSSNDNDHDDDGNDHNDDHHDNDDDGHDGGGGSSSVAVAGGGGAFASAG